MKKLIVLIIIAFTAFGCPKEVEPQVCTDAQNRVENMQILPASHPLHTAITSLNKDTRSDNIIAFLASGSSGIKADFGSGTWDGAPIGIPFVAVCKDQPLVPITFKGDNYDGNYGDQSDPGPYPIPLSAPVEGNGKYDSHVIAVDVDNKKIYELYNANVSSNGWQASCGAIFDLTKEEYRPAGWTSADAAGLPIFPCLVRYDEVASGEIDHAIRFTLARDKVMKGYTHPARHLISGANANSSIPTPMGMRLRLRADFDISTFSSSNQVILVAMKKYGIILADIGTSFHISGAPDTRWNNDDLLKLGSVKPADFQVVEMGPIITN